MRHYKIALVLLITIALGSCTHFERSVEQDDIQASKSIFPKGEKVENQNFTGTVWLQMMVSSDSTFNTSMGNVTFEPGARSNWHYHPGGQILLATSGLGRYQEQGGAVREVRAGEVVTCKPNVKHWHGAAPDSEFSHVAIGTNTSKGAVVWLKPVTEEEYNNSQ